MITLSCGRRGGGAAACDDDAAMAAAAPPCDAVGGVCVAMGGDGRECAGAVCELCEDGQPCGMNVLSA